MQNSFTNKLRTFFVILLLCISAPAYALETAAQQAILLDYDTSAELFAKHADEPMHPSSMSKMMTLYVLFSRLKDGSVKLDDQFTVSEHAWRMEGSRSFLKLGAQVPVEDLIHGIIVQSGNDACVVVAEGLASSEETFAKELNETAARLGMTHSHFVNATGMPDEKHQTTARDLAILVRHLIDDFPEYYHYFGEKEFTHNNITQGNRNPLLGEMGVDGLKTGHTEAGGFGIALSAKEAESGRRLILILNGMKSMQERADESRNLLRHGFLDFMNRPLAKAGQTVLTAPVWQGKSSEVALTVAKDTAVSLPSSQQNQITFAYSGALPLVAPVSQGAQAGELIIRLPDQTERRVPLVAAAEVPALSAPQRWWANLKYRLGMKPANLQEVH